MKLYISIFIIAIFLGGCSTAEPPMIEYRVSVKPTIEKESSAQGCSKRSLKVAAAFSSSSLMSMDMNYALGDNKQYTYSQSQYATSPNYVITSEVLKLLREMKIFKTVQISKSRSRNDYILEISIDDFMQYFSEAEKSSYVNVVISFTLIDTKDSTSIATRTFSSKVNSSTLDAEGGVKALGIAFEEVLNSSSKWFTEVCR